jgi:hypothetical protein
MCGEEWSLVFGTVTDQGYPGEFPLPRKVSTRFVTMQTVSMDGLLFLNDWLQQLRRY